MSETDDNHSDVDDQSNVYKQLSSIEVLHLCITDPMPTGMTTQSDRIVNVVQSSTRWFFVLLLDVTTSIYD